MGCSLLSCICCGPRKGKPRRGRRRGHSSHDPKLGAELNRDDISCSDFHSCRDNFSEYSLDLSGDACSPQSPTGEPATLASSPQDPNNLSAMLSASDSSDIEDMGDTTVQPGVTRLLAGCLPLLENLPIVGSLPVVSCQHETVEPHPHQRNHHHHNRVTSRRSGVEGGKPEAGGSLPKRDMDRSAKEVTWCWEDAGTSPFQVRSLDYMKTKVKVQTDEPIYEMVACDLFSVSSKKDTQQIGRMVQLPPAPPPVLYGDTVLPPLIIINLQLPMYQPSLFGSTDGPGVSIVFYFRVREGTDPNSPALAKPLNALKRLIANGREGDGSPTRERLKLIPRVVNVAQWAVQGPLSTAEHKLLTTYNEKPILTRPQHTFFSGRSYFEINLDLHQYAFLARKALVTYLTRLKHVVWEVAFVIQGNCPEELPEHILAAARMYRVDFQECKPWSQHLAAAAAAVPPSVQPPNITNDSAYQSKKGPNSVPPTNHANAKEETWREEDGGEDEGQQTFVSAVGDQQDSV